MEDNKNEKKENENELNLINNILWKDYSKEEVETNNIEY